MWIRRFGEWIAKLESILLTLFLLAIIGIGFTQIILRNFFSQHALSWSEISIRHLFFVLGFLSAMVATREGSHLAMDLLSRFLSEKIKRPVDILICFVSAGVCFLLAKFCYEYVLTERAYALELLQSGEQPEKIIFDIPVWWAYAVMPVGFALIALRFTTKALSDLFLKAQTHEEPS